MRTQKKATLRGLFIYGFFVKLNVYFINGDDNPYFTCLGCNTR